MKKILVVILGLIIIMIATIGIAFILPNINKTYNLGETNMKIKIPYSYVETGDTSKTHIINLYNSRDEIKISATNLIEDFWSSGDTEARIDEYLKVMSSANYDSNMKNVKKEVIGTLENKVGRVEFELSNLNDTYKSITIIPNEEIGNLVIEIIGTKEAIDNNKNEIEKIINTISI